MQKILLAIDGLKPSRSVFRYAVQLCQILKAELSVLQIITPKYYSACFKKIREKAQRAGQYLEGAMAAAAFAEAGEHETANAVMDEARKNLNMLLPETEKAGVPVHLTTRSGRSGKEIIHFVKKHRDVVLTIYDAAEEDSQKHANEKKRKTPAGKIGHKLPIPLVIVRNQENQKY